ncbi:phage holin family protein [Collinsella bouchesdurhonensis]|uniref:phage holin family protein n=1 Tax=Collinsella bouchesdurhonensis TaxID=1907654 RepID=UPI001106D0BD|nr:phage holin family protein [Collinsella bouchesdurhonensis]
MESIIQLAEPEVWALGTAFATMLIDVVVGFSQSLITGSFSSSVMRIGLGHKFITICIMALSVILEAACSHVAGLPFSGVTTVVVSGYVIVMEVGSILENAAKAYPELRDSPLFRLFEDEKKGA